ncbi:MAG: hypothetical protein FWD22_05835 [Treponema sp.]|nr:hypothetical protein [Treponema sp.]
MSSRILIGFVIFFLASAAVFSQDAAQDDWQWQDNDIDLSDDNRDVPRKDSDFWIIAGGEAAMYSQIGYAFGGGLMLGYGSGASIGFKAAMFVNEEKIDTLEFNLLLRFYLHGKNAYTGPYLQLMGGPAFFNRVDDFSIPSTTGMFSGGLSFGWRFVFFDKLIVEPAIRGGYPYMFGAAISAGVRF